MVVEGTTTPATSVSISKSVKASALILDAAGKPVPNTLVAFALDNSAIAKLEPASGVVVTDANGVASVRVDALSFGSGYPEGVRLSWAASVPSSTSGGTPTPVTGETSLSVGAAAVTLTNLKSSVATGSKLSAYATTTFTVTVNVDGKLATQQIAVGFSSDCVNAGKATISATAVSSGGVATATYADKGCGQTDYVRASAAGATTDAVALGIEGTSAASIQFVSASPSVIVIKGTGGTGLMQSSLVKFRLVDKLNMPIANKLVTLSLTTRNGGILLDGKTDLTVTRETNTAGELDVSVSSGTTPTSVWVIASHTAADNQVYTTQSSALRIATGVPAQDRFSLSISKLNIEGYGPGGSPIDGVTTEARVIASDRVGNPVPDGTTVNFASSGGQIGTGTLGGCQTVDGTCKVVFTSTSPRPAAPIKGRIKILAWANGEESFVDLNGDNTYNDGTTKDSAGKDIARESYTDLGNAYRDDNFSGVFDSGVDQQFQFASASEKKACPGTTANPATATTPATPAALSELTTCDGKWGAAQVRQSAVIILSGTELSISGTLSTSAPVNCNPVSTSFWATDENSNPMPEGTTLSVTNLPPKGWSVVITSDKVPNTSAYGIGTRHTITFTPTLDSANTCQTSRAFSAEISSKTPNGVSWTASSKISVAGSPTAVLSAPIIQTATPAAGKVDIAFLEPTTTAGMLITSYTATCTAPAPAVVRSATATGTASPLTVTGLDTGGAGTTYSCSVKATASDNSVSPASGVLTAVVP
jgi:hypothetical protein